MEKPKPKPRKPLSEPEKKGISEPIDLFIPLSSEDCHLLLALSQTGRLKHEIFIGNPCGLRYYIEVT